VWQLRKGKKAALSHSQNMNIHARILVVSYPWQNILLYRQMFSSLSNKGKKDTEQTLANPAKLCKKVKKEKEKNCKA